MNDLFSQPLPFGSNVSGYEAAVENVTDAPFDDSAEIERAHRNLDDREALLYAILDASPDALVVIDQQGLIRSFSSAAERLFGFAVQEVEGQNISMLMPASHREEHDRHLAHHIATGERRIIGVNRVVTGQRKDGSTFPMEIYVGEVNVPGMKVFAGFVRDVSERKEQERRVNELQTELVHVSRSVELGQMVAALAHEIADPLAAMSFYLATVRRQLAAGDVDAVQALLDKVLAQSDRTRQIVRRINDHVRKRATDRQVEDLSRIIEEASALAMVGTGKDVKLAVSINHDAREAVVDKIQIQQVLQNLMRNAVEAMTDSPGRELSISAARDGDMVEISVADTGPGLSRAARSKLFQPFNTTKPNGLGVGLSVCRLIVEAHGGKICADDGDNAGTVFRLTIPHHVESPAKRASSGSV
ncbi:MAG: PAS domain S-box protein [Rhizomicrobium sp.]